MHPILFQIENLEISTWSVCVAIGILTMAPIYLYRLHKLNVEDKSIDKLFYLAALAGLFAYLGASFFDNLWHAIDNHILYGTPVFQFRDGLGNWVGGVTFEGGILTGVIAYLAFYPLFMKNDRRHALNYLDQIVMTIPLAHAFGRLGCFFAGCCYGKETDCFLGMHYPVEGEMLKIFPTQLIEAVFLIILLIVLLFFIRKRITEVYLISYGVYRFLAEYLRGDSRGQSPFGALSPSQFLSIVMVVGAVIVFIARNKVRQKDLATAELEPQVRYFYPDYINIPKFIFKKHTCPECQKSMKIKAYSKYEEVNEKELMNHPDTSYYCKNCLKFYDYDLNQISSLEIKQEENQEVNN